MTLNAIKLSAKSPLEGGRGVSVGGEGFGVRGSSPSDLSPRTPPPSRGDYLMSLSCHKKKRRKRYAV